MKSKIFILLALVVFLVGCATQPATQPAQTVCNKPYILVGNDCCLDKDDNSICDRDEVEEKSVEKETRSDTELTDEEFLNIYCDSDATTLKKETSFENLKGKYVTWEGTIKRITSNYEMGIKLCDDTWTWDIDVMMRDDQKSSLLELNEGDKVIFKARLKSIKGFLTDLSAEDGEIISGIVKEAKQESEPIEVKQEVQSSKGYENTKNGVTLTVEGYTFEKKTDAYGKLKDISIVIYNHQGSDSIFPDLLMQVVDKENSEFTILKEIELSEYISTGESIHRTIEVDLGIAGIENPKEMNIHVKEYRDTIVTVYFDTNLLEGFKVE